MIACRGKVSAKSARDVEFKRVSRSKRHARPVAYRSSMAIEGDVAATIDFVTPIPVSHACRPRAPYLSRLRRLLTATCGPWQHHLHRRTAESSRKTRPLWRAAALSAMAEWHRSRRYGSSGERAERRPAGGGIQGHVPPARSGRLVCVRRAVGGRVTADTAAQWRPATPGSALVSGAYAAPVSGTRPDSHTGKAGSRGGHGREGWAVTFGARGPWAGAVQRAVLAGPSVQQGVRCRHASRACVTLVRALAW